MKKSTKKGMRLAAVLLALVMAVGGSLAYFTDYADTSASGTAGTVDIQLDGYGINLLDADGKDILNPGDSRDVFFNVNNLGNKSVDVRTTITLTSSVPMVTDANGQAQFELYVAGDVESIKGEGWQPKDGATPLEIRSISADGRTITYAIPDYILNGVPSSETFMGIPMGSADCEVEPDALRWDEIKGVEPAVQGESQIAEYRLCLIFRGDSSNDYQGATVTLNVLVEAKQHRNTEAGWELVAEEGAIVPGNGYTDGDKSGSGDIIMDENGEINQYWLDNGLIGMNGNITGDIMFTFIAKDQTYILTMYDNGSIDGGLKATSVPTDSYTINGDNVTASFTYNGQKIEFSGIVASNGSQGECHMVTVDGVVVYEDTGSEPDQGGDDTSDSALREELIANGYEINNDIKDYEVLYKTMYDGKGDCLSVYVYDNTKQAFRIFDERYYLDSNGNASGAIDVIEFVYEDGKMSVTEMSYSGGVTHESLTADGYEMNNDTKDYVLYYKAMNDGKDYLSMYVYSIYDGDFITGEERAYFDGVFAEGPIAGVINFIYESGKMSTSVITQSGGESGGIETPTDDYYIYESLSKEGYYEYNFNKDYIVMARDDGKQVVMYVFDTSSGSYQMIDTQYVESENGYAEVKTSVGYFVYDNGNIYAQ